MNCANCGKNTKNLVQYKSYLVCKECIKLLVSKCSICHETTPKSDILELKGNKKICKKCFHKGKYKNWKFLNCCQFFAPKSDARITDNGVYCKKCFKEKFIKIPTTIKSSAILDDIKINRTTGLSDKTISYLKKFHSENFYNRKTKCKEYNLEFFLNFEEDKNDAKDMLTCNFRRLLKSDVKILDNKYLEHKGNKIKIRKFLEQRIKQVLKKQEEDAEKAKKEPAKKTHKVENRFEYMVPTLRAALDFNYELSATPYYSNKLLSKADCEYLRKDTEDQIIRLSKKSRKLKVKISNYEDHKRKAGNVNSRFGSCQVPRHRWQYALGFGDMFVNSDALVCLVSDNKKTVCRMLIRKFKHYSEPKKVFYAPDRMYSQAGDFANVKYEIQADIIYELNKRLEDNEHIILMTNTNSDCTSPKTAFAEYYNDKLIKPKDFFTNKEGGLCLYQNARPFVIGAYYHDCATYTKSLSKSKITDMVNASNFLILQKYKDTLILPKKDVK